MSVESPAADSPILLTGGETSAEFQEIRRRLEEYERLLDIGVQLTGTLELSTILNLALVRAEEVCRAETSSIWEVDEERRELFFRVVRGRTAEEIRHVRIPCGVGIAGTVARTGQPELVNDVAADPRWRGDFQAGFRTRALLAVPLVAHGTIIGVLQLLNPVGKERFSPDDLRRMQLFAGMLAHPLQNARLYQARRRQFMETVLAWAEAIERKDPYTGGHVRRVTGYSLLLGAELRLVADDMEELWLASTLHDVGKIFVSDAILGKPAPLTPEETVVMNAHPVDGEHILAGVKDLRRVLAGVRNHHERFDGRGYPDGLKGEEIPLAARIIAVADTFDAMTTSRPYRQGLGREQAAREIAAGAGTQFCPQVVAAFLALFDAGRYDLDLAEALWQPFVTAFE
jgi:HD-GYP domain-containing protein (c-di-GMP phosphodiesterase class II)